MLGRLSVSLCRKTSEVEAPWSRVDLCYLPRVEYCTSPRAMSVFGYPRDLSFIIGRSVSNIVASVMQGGVSFGVANSGGNFTKQPSF